MQAAVQHGDVDKVKELIESGEPIDVAPEGGATPLYIASWLGNAELVSILLEAGADPNTRRESDKACPLIVSVMNSHLSVVQLLIQNKDTNLEAAMEGGCTALLLATANGQFKIMEALLATGRCSPNTADNTGIPPLFVAAGMGQIKLMEMLLKEGALIDQQNNEGWPPLAAACHYRKKDAVFYLLRKGALLDCMPSKTKEKQLAKKLKREIEQQ